MAYACGVPRLWSETIEVHRREVRDAILDTTAGLAAQHGLLHVTMSQVAEETGIGRSTLYKYFSSVEEILHAWHDRQISSHLQLLTKLAARGASPLHRLSSVLEAYAQIQRQRTDHGAQPHGGALAAFLHRDEQLAPAERRLHDLLRALLAAAADRGQVRSDVSADELATYCLHALSAAPGLASDAAAGRLVGVILDGVRPLG